jgi:hypothetical protein
MQLENITRDLTGLAKQLEQSRKQNRAHGALMQVCDLLFPS